MPKEYTVKLVRNDNGTWVASTPKTKAIGGTGPEALRNLAGMLETKAKFPEHAEIFVKLSDLINKIS